MRRRVVEKTEAELHACGTFIPMMSASTTVVLTRQRLSTLRPALENFLGRVAPWQTRNRAPGMGSRAAQVKILDWRSITRPAGNRAHKKNLIQSDFAVVDMAFRQAEGLFQI